LAPAFFDLEQSEPIVLEALAAHTHEECGMQSMDDLFYALLQDAYSAENELLKALPELAKKSTNKTLQQAFADDRDETEEHLERLEKVFEAIGKMPQGKTCAAMLGIIAEGQHVIDEVKDGAVRDAGILAAARAAEHYQIARYGTLRAWAELLGEDEIVELLSDTLEEKKHADELLSWIAEGGVNESASQRPQAAE
jgi:ferritin-like metal-binding protein YciE